MSGWIRVRKKSRPLVPVAAQNGQRPAAAAVAATQPPSGKAPSPSKWAEALGDSGEEAQGKRPRPAEVEDIEGSPLSGAREKKAKTAVAGESDLSPEALEVLAVWSRARDARSPVICDSDEERREREEVEDVEDEERLTDSAAQRKREPLESGQQQEMEEDAGDKEEVEDEEDKASPRKKRAGTAAFRRIHEEDEIQSSSQGSPVAHRTVVPPAAGGVAKAPAATRFVVAANVTAQGSVQLLNRAAAVRRDVPPHRLWLREWRADGGDEWRGTCVVRGAGGEQRPAVLFSRHARHAGLQQGAWLRYAALSDCGCAVTRETVALCEHCSLEEDFDLEAEPMELLSPPLLSPLSLIVPDRVRCAPLPPVVLASCAVAPAAASRALPPPLAAPAVLRLRPAAFFAPLRSVAARFWCGSDECERHVLLQCPPEFADMDGPVEIVPAPGLFAVRRERLGEECEGAGVVWVGQVTKSFRITAW